MSSPPKRWDNTKLVVKLDVSNENGGSKLILTPLYEIESGPRNFDTSGWKLSDEEGAAYMDILRWQMLNIIQSSLEGYCKAALRLMVLTRSNQPPRR